LGNGDTVLIAVISVLGALLVGGWIVLVLTCLECRRRRRKHATTSLQQLRTSPHRIVGTHAAYLQMLDCLPQEADKWELQRSDFQLESNIGSGNWGTVFKGILKFTACSEAVNRYKAQMMTEGKSINAVAIKELIQKRCEVESQENIKAFLAEIELMKKVSEGNNSHVVKMVGCVTLSIPLALILEYVPQGNLRDYLKTARTKCGMVSVSEDQCPVPSTVATVDQDILEEQTTDSETDQHVKEDGKCIIAENNLTSFAFQIANGMQYLSSLGVIHRDLACRNILVDDTEVLKIADFGLARNTEEYMSSMKDKLPIRWMAPETFLSGSFTEKSDVWSFGVCLWEIFSLGTLPYKDLENTTIVPKILGGYRLQQPYMCPDHAYTVMMQCCEDNPDKRPTFATLRSIFDGFVSSGTDTEYLHLEMVQ
jgi:proto-oncogene tyrosine-protein kinase Ret